jgi:hypothetical protein
VSSLISVAESKTANLRARRYCTTNIDSRQSLFRNPKDARTLPGTARISRSASLFLSRNHGPQFRATETFHKDKYGKSLNLRVRTVPEAFQSNLTPSSLEFIRLGIRPATIGHLVFLMAESGGAHLTAWQPCVSHFPGPQKLLYFEDLPTLATSQCYPARIPNFR